MRLRACVQVSGALQRLPEALPGAVVLRRGRGEGLQALHRPALPAHPALVDILCNALPKYSTGSFRMRSYREP